jgi:hypothetical protein
MVGVFSQHRERIKVRTEGWLLVSEQLIKGQLHSPQRPTAFTALQAAATDRSSKSTLIDRGYES